MASLAIARAAPIEEKCRHQRSSREIPSFRISAFSVVRGIPRRAAALLTMPPASRSTRVTCSRSTCSSVLSPGGHRRIRSDFVEGGARRFGPPERMTALSMKFSSSRTLPGHGQLTKARVRAQGRLPG